MTPRAPRRWERRGLLLSGSPQRGWTHAALPSVVLAGDADGWLYFSDRDERGRAHVSRVALHRDDDVLTVDADRGGVVLAPGALGAFDDAGCTNSCVVEHDGRQLLFYSGWALGRSVPFYFYVGAAASTDGGATFARVHEAPVLERSPEDPFLTASPSVLADGTGRLRAWYVSCSGWSTPDARDAAAAAPRHRYDIRAAGSSDGLAWTRDATPAVALEPPTEHAFGRPCVVDDGDGRLEMWFCARGDRYQLAYASSDDDGATWQRQDAGARLAGDAAEWEHEERAYPWVFDWGPHRFLLYNGNGYGRTGIGYAVLEDAA